MAWRILIFIMLNGFSMKSQHMDHADFITKEVQVVDLTIHKFSNAIYVEVSGKDAIHLLQDSGKIRILRKISTSAYIVKITSTFDHLDATAIKYAALVNNKWKFSTKAAEAQTNKGMHIYTVVGIDRDCLSDYLTANNVNHSIKHFHKPSKTSSIQLDLGAIDLVLAHEEVTHIDVNNHRPVEESFFNEVDLRPNKINLIHKDYPSINGSDFTVAVKERNLDLNNLNIQGRIKHSGKENSSISDHANDMATIIGGGGNSAENALGAAYGCKFTSIDFLNPFPEENAFYNDDSIFIQNHSYGYQDIDNRYSAEAAAYDISANQNPKLLHIISSGNLGLKTSDQGTYSGIDGYANLSGSFKMAKNNLVINAYDKKFQINPKNSNGPAHDGRLKPELAAYGEYGTSDAASLASGITTLLQDYFKRQNGYLPTSALLKAILISGAKDIHHEGIDFKTGYGSIDSRASASIIEDHQYISDTLTSNQNFTHDVIIDNDNLEELKITIVWNDPAASAEAERALINDLDIKLINTQSGDEWLPWVLNTQADIASLSMLAHRGRDSINNVEQISIANPKVGTYKIQVSSMKLTTDEQVFHIAYNLVQKEDFRWTFPQEGEILKSNAQDIIRWSSTASQNVDFEYSINNGASWYSMGTKNAQELFFDWLVPEHNGMALLRARINGTYYESESFRISDMLDLKVGYNCDSTFMLQWNAIPLAQSYQIFQMEEQYMTVTAETFDTFYMFEKSKYPSLYYTMAPIYRNGIRGHRAPVFNHQLQGQNCYFSTFFASNIENETVLLDLSLSTTINVSKIVFERKKNESTFKLLKEISVDPGRKAYTFDDIQPLQGRSFYRAKIYTEDGQIEALEPIPIFIPPLSHLSVFPNPLIGNDFINISARANSGSIQIIDIKGQIVQEFDIIYNRSSFYIDILPKGIYFIRLIDKNKILAREKLVIL